MNIDSLDINFHSLDEELILMTEDHTVATE